MSTTQNVNGSKVSSKSMSKAQMEQLLAHLMQENDKLKSQGGNQVPKEVKCFEETTKKGRPLLTFQQFENGKAHYFRKESIGVTKAVMLLEWIDAGGDFADELRKFVSKHNQ